MAQTRVKVAIIQPISQNQMTEIQSDPQPRTPGRGSFLLNININRGVLLILCCDSSLASEPGVAVLVC